MNSKGLLNQIIEQYSNKEIIIEKNKKIECNNVEIINCTSVIAIGLENYTIKDDENAIYFKINNEVRRVSMDPINIEETIIKNKDVRIGLDPIEKPYEGYNYPVWYLSDPTKITTNSTTNSTINF